jgi:FAD synthetase
MGKAELDLYRRTFFSRVVLLLIVFSSSLGESFVPPHCFGKRPLRQITEMASPAAVEPTCTRANNWRVIPAESDDHAAQLLERPTWSETQYQESLQLYKELTSCSDAYVHPGIKMALNTLDHAYRLYGPASVICSFNGGKDAVVILHLVRAAHAKHYSDLRLAGKNEKMPIVRPRVVYFNHPDEFPEVIDFLHQSVENYDLDMVAFEEGVKFADGLKIVVENNYFPGCNITYPVAFVLGTRSSDPNAMGQDHFSPSSHWMPPFMRVNPVLEWNYGHVWHFLRLFQLPYCRLYDEGYTSLGTTKDTMPCPALAVPRGSSENNEEESNFPKYWPAYMLRDWEQERAGRIKKEAQSPAAKKMLAVELTQGAAPSSVSVMSIGAQLETRTDILEESIPETASCIDGSALGEAVDDASATSLDCLPCQQKTVGILIIGDEILKGLTLDKNTNAAAKALRKECVKLSKVVIVSDDQEEIVKDIQRLQSEVDVIITSGGVGPTHDDVTIKSVAAFLDRPLLLHNEMAELLREKMNNGSDEPLTQAQIKMATLPSNAKLRYLSSKDDWPVLQCRNIFILPGVPEYFSMKIQGVASYLSSQLERSTAYKIVLRVDEAAIVDALNDTVDNHPNVTFGSYPFVSHPEYKTVLTLEGSLIEGNQKERNIRNSTVVGFGSPVIPKSVRDQYVRVALDDLIQKLPKDSILRVENDDLTPFT